MRSERTVTEKQHDIDQETIVAKARKWAHVIVKRARVTPEKGAQVREYLEFAWISGYAEALADVRRAHEAAQPQGTLETTQ